MTAHVVFFNVFSERDPHLNAVKLTMAMYFFLISMQDSIFEHEIFSIKEIYLMGGFKSSYLFILLEFFFTRNYVPLLSVNLLSVKPVSLSGEIWGHRFQLGVLECRA